MKTDINEKYVTQAWQSLIESVGEFNAENGESLRIIYPGKISDAPGSDFQDAVIKIDGQLTRGNIEIHVNSSNWRTHRHHRDSTYNRVVLHVVMWHDTPDNTELADGSKIPVIALYRYLKAEKKHRKCICSIPLLPCSGISEYYGDAFSEILEQCGKLRYYEKIAQFQAELKNYHGEECLYRNIMAALGYSRNTIPFKELSGRVPLSMLESIVKATLTDEEKLLRLQALLTGNAGLLPSQRQSSGGDDTEIMAFESLWENMQRDDIMSSADWQIFRVRPSNSPIRRIAGISRLILRYQERGLLEEIIEIIREAPLEKGHQQLEAALTVAGEDYWAHHFDFGRECHNISPLLIGQSRAADIVINVLLPFTGAWSKNIGKPKLEEKALDIYCGYPAISPNTIEKHMRGQLGLQNKQVNSANHQQGLLNIYKKWCTQGKCQECAVNRNRA